VDCTTNKCICVAADGGGKNALGGRSWLGMTSSNHQKPRKPWPSGQTELPPEPRLQQCPRTTGLYRPRTIIRAYSSVTWRTPSTRFRSQRPAPSTVTTPQPVLKQWLWAWTEGDQLRKKRLRQVTALTVRWPRSEPRPGGLGKRGTNSGKMP
jgi:hypothetical protein